MPKENRTVIADATSLGGTPEIPRFDIWEILQTQNESAGFYPIEIARPDAAYWIRLPYIAPSFEDSNP